MKGLTQITDSNAIMKGIDEVVANNPRPLEQHRAGRKALFGFFVGQTMKVTRARPIPRSELVAIADGGRPRRRELHAVDALVQRQLHEAIEL